MPETDLHVFRRVDVVEAQEGDSVACNILDLAAAVQA
jgi:hypothetical protein